MDPAVAPPLPPGFVLDEDVPPLPQGFTLDAPAAMMDRVPIAGDTALPPGTPPAAEPSIWEKFKQSLDDPVLNMWGHGLATIAKGAPEVALDTAVNTGVQAVAGLTAPFMAPSDTRDATHYIEDFTRENSMYPQGESAQDLTEGLGEAFAPVGNIKTALGEGAYELTGSPAVATTAEMLPDLGMTLFGGPKATKPASRLDTARTTRFDVKPGVEGGKFGLTDTPAANPAPPARMLDRSEFSGARPDLPEPAPVVNPKVGDLRAADLRLRPSDVRAMTPGAKKVPGEFREKFADGPGMKKDMTLHNQQKLTDAVAKDIGVKALDETSLAKAKEAPASTYDMVESVLMDQPMSPEFISTFKEAAASAKLPKGEGSSVTRIIGALRRRAAKRMQNEQVATEEAGFADRELADRLEEALGTELDAVGEPQLIDDYRAARQQFAKIHDVETASRAGQIDAAQVLKLKKRSVKLTGGLALAADASEHAPNVTQHSLKTAAREGDQIEGSREGLIKRGIKAAVRQIPGVDVGSESFQRTLGLPDEARASYAGQAPFKDKPPRAPEQADMLGDSFDLEQPPGEVGVALPKFMRGAPTEQADMLGNAFEFERPPGEVGIPPEAQMSLQELLGLGEPLAMKQPPGRVGKPKRRE